MAGPAPPQQRHQLDTGVGGEQLHALHADVTGAPGDGGAHEGRGGHGAQCSRRLHIYAELGRRGGGAAFLRHVGFHELTRTTRDWILE